MSLDFPTPFLAGVSLSTAVFLYLVIYFARNPEKFQKWVSLFGWLISFIWKRADYFAIKNEVQGKINSYVGNLEANTTIQLPRVKVRWAAEGGKEEIIWEDYEAILVMRDRKHRNKNFVHAAYFFTSEVLLKKPKRHLSKNLKVSLDLFATKKLLELESKAAVEQFISDYFSPQIEKQEDIRDYIKQYVKIDNLGVFFPVLIQELTYLGNKVFLDKPTENILKEVKGLIDFLEAFSQREVGDTTIQDSFAGSYLICSIKIVASRYIRESGYTQPNKERINRAIEIGFENIYVLGSASQDNQKFIDSIIKELLEEHPHIELAKRMTFPGLIFIHGAPTKVSTYFVHLHNPNVVNHVQ